MFTDNPGMLKYAETITDEFNKWADAYAEATVDNSMNMENMSIAAFMCNAISGAVLKSNTEGLGEYFGLHARKI